LKLRFLNLKNLHLGVLGKDIDIKEEAKKALEEKKKKKKTPAEGGPRFTTACEMFS